MDETQSWLRGIFNRALELEDRQQRRVYLAGACANDEAMRRKLERLLDAHDKAGGFLNTDDERRETAQQDDGGEEIGSIIGRYKLLQKIGEGGCGMVYMAEQSEPVRRRVALKVIKLGMDSKQVVARFEAERQALALMDHPNIAKVFDAGATETGRPYFVMELVRGVRITDYCDQARLSTQRRLELVIQVCKAVQHAHQKGILHRDLKPSNILVTVNDGVPVPKVIDFGIAKATTGQPLTDKTIFTAFEQFIGTPAYMSPEQAVMTSLDIDTRSDIYSLGVLLYELLTGSTPFDAKELLAAGLDTMRQTIREREPQPPSARLSTLQGEEMSVTAQRRAIEPLALIGQLRGDLDWIVMKCLDKERARRYETADGLALDLERYLKNEPVTARPPSNIYRFQKLVRRNKLAFAAAGAVLGALVCGLGLSTWLFLKERQARQQAVSAEKVQRQLRQEAENQRQKATIESQKSQQVAQLLKNMLKGVGPSVALGRDTTLLKEILDKTAESMGGELTNQPEVEVELRATLCETYEELGLDEQAERIAQEAVQLGRTRLGSENLALAHALDVLSWAQWKLREFEQGEQSVRQALAIREKLLGPQDASVADSLDKLAYHLMDQKRYQEVESVARQALALRKSLFGDEHPLVAKSLATLGTALWAGGKAQEAEPYARRAVEVDRKLLGNEHFNTSHALNKLAEVLTDLGQLPEAESVQGECLAIERKLYGKSHSELVLNLALMGDILELEHKNDEAETFYRELLNMRANLSQNPNSWEQRTWVAYFINHRAAMLRKSGKLDEAATTSQLAKQVESKVLGDERQQ